MPAPFIRATAFLATTADKVGVTNEEIEFLNGFVARPNPKDEPRVNGILEKYQFPMIPPQ